MSGNERDAERIVEQVMPPGMGSTMSPFLRRLASLTPAQRARAVTFGTMPDAGARTSMLASADPSFRPVDASTAGRLMPVDPPPAPVEVADETSGKKRKASKAPRRRPGRDDGQIAVRDPLPQTEAKRPSEADGRIDSRLNSRLDTRLASIDPQRLPPEVRAALLTQTVKVSPPAASLPPVKIAATPPPSPTPVIVRSVVDPEANPAPVFEIPMPTMVKPSPPPVTIRPVTLPPATIASPPPTSVFIVPPPPVKIYAPAPQPVFVAPAPSPPPPPVVVAISPPPPPPAFVAAPPPPTATGPSRADAGLVPAAAQSEPVRSGPVEPAPAKIAQADPPPTAAPAVGLSSILAGIVPEEESKAAPLPSFAELKAARVAAQKKAAVEAAAKAEKEAKAAAATELAAKAKRNPARVWVQVATGSNEAGLPGTWKKLKEKAPDVFKGQSASVVPYKATNRVVVGPFKSQADARAFVNSMGKAGIQGSTYSSDPGQEVARIGGK
jgi:SPOR domain